MKQLDKQELDERFDCMKKKQIIPLIVLILIVVGVCVWMNRVNYDVCEDTSNVEINPLEGIDVKIDAKRKQGNIQIENNSNNYIVIDFSQRRIQIEIQKEDGWHKLTANNIVQAQPCAIPEGTTYSLDFEWRNSVDGPLKSGNYRAILYFGDGTVKPYDFYSVTTEFCVE